MLAFYLAAEGSSSPALQVLVDPSVLADPSQPPAEIQLKIPSPTSSGNSADSALQTQTVTATHRPDVHAPGVWVGQLAGFEGPLSVVTLVQQSGPSAVIYGDVLYVDRDAGFVHSYKVGGALDFNELGVVGCPDGWMIVGWPDRRRV